MKNISKHYANKSPTFQEGQRPLSLYASANGVN